MDAKFSSLLSNVPVKHGFGMIEPSVVKVKIMSMADTGLFNFFVLGSMESIKEVLDVAGSLNMLQSKKFSWTVLTKENVETVSCTSCDKVKIMHLYPMAKGNEMSVEGLRRSYGIRDHPDVDVAFYFDAGLKALKAIR